MKNTSADLLEFGRLKALLARYIGSALGHAELEKVAPSADRPTAERMLSDVAEAIDYLESASKPQPAVRGAAMRLRFSSLPDPGAAVAKLRIEGVSLEAKEIYELSEFLDRAADMRAILLAVADRFPKLAARGAAIGEFRPLLREISGKILPDGTVADHASVALARLRRDIEKQKKGIHDSLERFLTRHREEGVLQEEYVAIRNERFVVPVIAGRQRRIDGVIHGASGSGHTLFVEPLETIELNNELVRLTEEEMREVHRILLEFTARLRDSSEAIARTVGILAELELLFAKATFATDFGATVPKFSPQQSRRIFLRDTRHPLLQDVLRKRRTEPIPFTLVLEGEQRTLLISGPNSGGKTVTLKTVGLLALMAQAGIPVTAAEAEFPFFDQVLADIGDQQSIQESLSTFSAHMSRIRDTVDEVTGDSLVLLDELGRATDPEEGGALGVAVLDRFRSSGAFTLASTHLLALKVYGATAAGVLNGSMGFDEDTLEPTYILRVGAPGKSAGIDIARRMGVPAPLLEKARENLSHREQDIARFLNELNRRLEDVRALQTGLEEQKARLTAREKSLADEWARKETAKLKELERRTEETIEKFEAQARETLDSIATSADQKRAAQRVAKAKRELREEVETTVFSTRVEAQHGPGALKVEPGVRVRLRNVRELARVTRLLANDLVEVQAGFLKMQVSRDDVLEVLQDGGQERKLPKGVTYQPGPEAYTSVREINVIGNRAEEALEKVDKFLDSAVMGSINRVRIVHGHGMGILKRAVADLLAKNPNVEKFYPASPNEGGNGATIVELKE